MFAAGRSSARRTGAAAFTVLELLVVVGVIGVLAGLVVPALAGARQTSRRIQCLHNLKQLATAVFIYTNDNFGYFPPAYYAPRREGDRLVTEAWDYTTVEQDGKITVTSGLLWQGQLDVGDVQQCPSFAGSHRWIADPHTGYNYNTSYIGRGSSETVRTPAMAANVANPGRTVLFGDGEYRNGANKFMRSPFPSPYDASFFGRSAGTQGFRHQDMTNVVFCDGHAESLRECYTVTDPSDAGNIARGTGFLSPDNSLYDLE